MSQPHDRHPYKDESGGWGWENVLCRNGGPAHSQRISRNQCQRREKGGMGNQKGALEGMRQDSVNSGRKAIGHRCVGLP